MIRTPEHLDVALMSDSPGIVLADRLSPPYVFTFSLDVVLKLESAVEQCRAQLLVSQWGLHLYSVYIVEM